MQKELEINSITDQFELFPGTRYMGSKNKIIDVIGESLLDFNFSSFYDAFGGSNVVGYYFKSKGKKVITNDFMALSSTMSKAIIENSQETLSDLELDFLLNNKNNQSFIAETFDGLYFYEDDNKFLDRVRKNIDFIESDYKRSIALSALARSCVKKRPRGIFTYTGHRYDDGRQDIQLSLEEHFIRNVELFNEAVFDNGESCIANNGRTEELNVHADVVYLDPPYFTPNSDNDYVRRYHFVEGLIKNWKGVNIQEHTKTKKIESYKSPFAKRKEAYKAFENLISKFKDSIIVISYSSNSQPSKEELTSMLSKVKKSVKLIEVDHLYSFGNQKHKVGNNANRVKEYLFIGY